MDGGTGGRKEGRGEGWLGGGMDGWITNFVKFKWMRGWMDELTERRKKGGTQGRRQRRIDEWMGG